MSGTTDEYPCSPHGVRIARWRLMVSDPKILCARRLDDRGLWDALIQISKSRKWEVGMDWHVKCLGSVKETSPSEAAARLIGHCQDQGYWGPVPEWVIHAAIRRDITRANEEAQPAISPRRSWWRCFWCSAKSVAAPVATSGPVTGVYSFHGENFVWNGLLSLADDGLVTVGADANGPTYTPVPCLVRAALILNPNPDGMRSGSR